MKLKVIREASQGGATLGRLYIDDVFACYTLEDEVREVVGEPVGNWKIHGATAIPAGHYKVTIENSARFGPETLTIPDVPGFKYIRIHAGNTSADTEGCLLLGMRATAVSLVGGTSKPAVALVKAKVNTALRSGQSVSIDISNPTAVA